MAEHPDRKTYYMKWDRQEKIDLLWLAIQSYRKQ